MAETSETNPPARAAVFDLDGTLTRVDTFLTFLIYALIREPRRWWRAPLLAGAVLMHKSGLRPNDWLKSFFLFQILGHLPAASRQALVASFLPDFLVTHLRTQAREQIFAHRQAGDHLVLLSASPDFLVEPIGQDLGFDTILCTHCESDAKGRITGNLSGGNCYGAAKVVRLQEWIKQPDRPLKYVAYSDHHSDLDLLRTAEEGFAVNPTKKLRSLVADLPIPILNWD